MKTDFKNLQSFMDEVSRWSDDTFDNGNFDRNRSIPISYHLQKESKELTESLYDYFRDKTDENFANVKEELADCLILLLDCSSHLKCDANELLAVCYDKLEINKKRKWGKPDKNGVVEHI